jgi:hypothetical protein
MPEMSGKAPEALRRSKRGHRRIAELDGANVHSERKRAHVTLTATSFYGSSRSRRRPDAAAHAYMPQFLTPRVSPVVTGQNTLAWLAD